jgi:hypothetical protein
MADQGAKNTAATSAPAGSRWLGVLQLLVPALAVLYVFSRFIPSASAHDYLFFDDLDCAWVQVLHDAFARHLQFGRDIVFTYGPWGFLARGYYPATYPVAVIVWCLLSVAFVVAARRLARNLSGNLFISWFWVVLLLAHHRERPFPLSAHPMESAGMAGLSVRLLAARRPAAGLFLDVPVQLLADHRRLHGCDDAHG